MAEAGVPGHTWPDTRHLDALVRAVASGENGAFDLIFRQLSAPVYSTARSLIADAAQAEEVAQDVLTEIWQTASR
jgi:RNA polymerase sigma-70 factor (ECF subfamily)